MDAVLNEGVEGTLKAPKCSQCNDVLTSRESEICKIQSALFRKQNKFPNLWNYMHDVLMCIQCLSMKK